MASPRERTTTEENGAGATAAAKLYAITPATEWRTSAVEGEMWTFPGSGKIVKLTRPGLRAMVARAKQIPNPISARVVKFLVELNETRFEPKTDAQKATAFIEETDIFVEIMRMVLVEPKLAPEGEAANPEQGTIDPAWIPDFDYTWVVYTFLEGAMERILPFRVAGWDGAPGLPRPTV